MKLEEFLADNKTKLGEIKYPIKKIKTTQDYVMVFLEEDKIMIPIESYFKYDLKNIKGLDDNLLNIFKEEEKILKAYRSCLRKLAVKDNTVKQIKDHLYKKELNTAEVNKIIDKLIEYNLLNDEKYCINKLNQYENSNISYKQIKTKLSKDGISDELIERYVINNSDKEYTKALHLADKYAKSLRNKSLRAKKQSIINKLVNLGFTLETSKNALDETVIDSDNELELLSKEYDKALKKYSKKYRDYELRQKIYASLLSKGFNTEDIKKILEV